MKKTLIYTLPDQSYPKDWRVIDNLENKSIGDKLMADQNFIGVKVRSAINTLEYNYLLNPLFPKYHDYIKILSVDKLEVDARLIK
uniref:hypothetical protein n=1 Tax=Pedobacter schmidteae TaxID=2201271 RepID=UPI0013CE8BE7|nr:hypothetical protein [Pedobacter schmidteae]